MRRLLSVAAALLVLGTPAAATAAPDGYAPSPDPTVQLIDRVPVVQLDDGGGGLPYLGSQTSYNAGDWETVLRAYVASGTYAKELDAIDAIALRQVKRVATLRKRKPRRFPRKPAIVFDVDETLLSNYSAIDADDFTFGVNSRAEATNQIGTRIEASLRVFQAAKARGFTIFLITGRGEDVREPTAQNLEREGFTGYKTLTLKPAGFEGTTVQYKSGARAAIEKQGYRIVANVGDQFSDLAGGHAQRAYKLPNPFYYLP